MTDSSTSEFGREPNRLSYRPTRPGAQAEREYTTLVGANMYRLMSGFAAEAETLLLRRAVSAFPGQAIPVEKALPSAVLASQAAITLWDFDSWDAVITRLMELARDAGALAPLSIGLNGEGVVLAWRGDFEAAARVTAEADAVKEATGSRVAPYSAQLFAALPGCLLA